MTPIAADWRFLEGVPRSGRALVIGQEVHWLESAFDVTALPESGRLPEYGAFDLVVIADIATEHSLNRAAEALAPGGLVVAGIGGPDSERLFGIPARQRFRGVRAKATRAGLLVHSVHGALPNPWNPEYLFPLDIGPAGFAFHGFLRSRRPGLARWLESKPRATHLLAALTTSGALLLLKPSEIAQHGS